jgi:catechol 2,3-dioxygenase-like lactoylglutathione lyase family enzyme
MDIHPIAPLLQVFDMPAAIHFYRDVLGFKVHATSAPGDNCNWAWLKLNGAELMLNTAYEANQRPAAPQPVRVGAHEDNVPVLWLQRSGRRLSTPARPRRRAERAESRTVRYEAAMVSRSRRLRPLLSVANQLANTCIVRVARALVWRGRPRPRPRPLSRARALASHVHARSKNRTSRSFTPGHSAATIEYRTESRGIWSAAIR